VAWDNPHGGNCGSRLPTLLQGNKVPNYFPGGPGCLKLYFVVAKLNGVARQEASSSAADKTGIDGGSNHPADPAGCQPRAVGNRMGHSSDQVLDH